MAGSATIHEKRLPLAGSSLRHGNCSSLDCPSSGQFCGCLSHQPALVLPLPVSRAHRAHPSLRLLPCKHAPRAIALTRHRTRCPAASQARRRRRDRSEARRVPPSRTAARMPMGLILECFPGPGRQSRERQADKRTGTRSTPRKTRRAAELQTEKAQHEHEP